MQSSIREPTFVSVESDDMTNAQSGNPYFVSLVGQHYQARVVADSDDALRDLLREFGSEELHSPGHRRAFCLGLSAIRRPLAWWGLPTTGPADEIFPTLRFAQECAFGSASPSLQQIGHVCHLGAGYTCTAKTHEDSLFAAFIYSAVAALCRFALYAGLPDLVQSMNGAQATEIEYYHRAQNEMSYDDWLIRIALPAAYQERLLNDDELNPGLKTTKNLHRTHRR